jgi:alpha-L-fucosidase
MKINKIHLTNVFTAVIVSLLWFAPALNAQSYSNTYKNNSSKKTGDIDEKHAKKITEIKNFAQKGPFKPDWSSLGQYKIPEWYQNAKFGIFIHWGIYSVPAHNGEWYPRWMYDPQDKEGDYYQYHRKNFGDLTQFGYKDFIPQFKAEKFNAADWARLFKEAGARYVIPVAEHHDGFAMYDSQYTRWNAANMGPKRDVIAELAKAIRQQGMYFGLSSHRAENWWFYGLGRKLDSDVNDDRYRDFYGPAMDRDASEKGLTPPDQAFLDDWLLRTVEIVDKYEPQILWFDWWMATPAFHQHLKDFSAYYYNKGAQAKEMVAINYKKIGGESYPDTAGVLDIERGQLDKIRELFWQTDTSVSKNSWGYIKNHHYKTPDSLVDDLIDIVSKNGALLLNIGPRPDGTLPEEEMQILKEMGAWLKLNGEAIYDTRPWVTFGEGTTQVIDGTMTNDAEHKRQEFAASDIRFTQKNGTIYAILMAWPGDKAEITIKSITAKNLNRPIRKVSLIGSDQNLVWKQTKKGLRLKLPKGSPHDFAQVLKIE